MVPLFKDMRMKIAKSHRFLLGTPKEKRDEWPMKPDFKMNEDTEALNCKATVHNLCVFQ